MANWENLKASITEFIKTNENQEITGQILQNVLISIVNNIGGNATFAGIATPETNPGAPDGSVFYLACTQGTYSNFNSSILDKGLYVLLYSGSNWEITKVGLSQDNLYDIMQKIIALNGYFTNNFFIFNGYYWRNNGSFQKGSDDIISTPYIPFKKGDILNAHNTQKGGGVYDNINFFDSNFGYISGRNYASSVIDFTINSENTPDNTAYVTLNGNAQSSITINSITDTIPKVLVSQDNRIGQLESDFSEIKINAIIEKNLGIYMNDGSIDNREDKYHTNYIAVTAGDKITLYSKVFYGNGRSGTIIMLNSNKEYVQYYTPGSALPLPVTYTIPYGISYIVVNSDSLDAELPLVNGVSVSITGTVQKNKDDIAGFNDRISSLENIDEMYNSIYTEHNKSLSKILGTYRDDAGYSISYPIPCKSGDVFSMSGFLAGTIANAWLLDEELTPIYVMSALSNQVSDNKWLNRTIPTVEGKIVAYMIACRKDEIDPDNFFELNGAPIPPLQYVKYLQNSDLLPASLAILEENGVTGVALVSQNGNKIGDIISLGSGSLTLGLKYNALGDSVTQASNLKKNESTYADLIAIEKGYIYDKTDTNNSRRFWIRIENNKEGVLIEDSSNITPVLNNRFGQDNNTLWGTDSSGNFYRRLYQNAFGGKAMYGECSIACNDVKYYEPDVISILSGANDSSGIDSTANPYKLGTISDVPVGIENYYLLDKVYTKEEIPTSILQADRKVGIRVYFKNSETTTDVLYYIGATTDDETWNSNSNWVYWYQLSFYSFYKGAIVNILNNNRSADVLIMNYLQHVENYGETTIGKIMQAIIDVAKYYHVRYVDLTNNSGVNSLNYYAYFNDGEIIDGWVDNIHPNAKGHLRMAQKIVLHL